jgi:hypothetical protein
MGHRLSVFLTVVVALGLTVPAALAIPYASAVTDQGGGDYSFVLNQDADVIIYRTGDTPLVLGTLSRGTHTFNIGAGTGFEICVTGQEASGWAQISDNSWNGVKFYSPKGVGVNRDPASQYFGWIYVSESLAGTTGGRTTTEGLYALLADCTDAIGQGDIAMTGGEVWTLSSAGPWRVHVGEDGLVYVCDWSDAHSGLWRFNEELSGLATEVLDSTGRDLAGLNSVHGSIAGFKVLGAGATLELYTLDEDFSADGVGGYVGYYDLSAGVFPYTGAPTEITDLHADVVNGTLGVDIISNGDFYWTQYRWNADYPSFMIFQDTGDPNNPNMLYSLTDVNLAYRGGVQVNEDKDWIIIGGYTGDFEIRDLNNPGTVLDAPGPAGYTRAVGYDAANNVYAANSSTELLTVWSPGGNWISITRSDGTFDQLCLGDIFPAPDGDGVVDLSDLARLLTNYGVTSGASYTDGDLDLDGDVQLDDLAALLSVYGTSCP